MFIITSRIQKDWQLIPFSHFFRDFSDFNHDLVDPHLDDRILTIHSLGKKGKNEGTEDDLKKINLNFIRFQLFQTNDFTVESNKVKPSCHILLAYTFSAKLFVFEIIIFCFHWHKWTNVSTCTTQRNAENACVNECLNAPDKNIQNDVMHLTRFTGSPPDNRFADATKNDPEFSATPVDSSKTHLVAPMIRLKYWSI